MEDVWVVVSAGHVGGTHGSGILSSVADVLWMSVVRGMRGVGAICEICMCLALGSEWMRGLGLGFTNPVGIAGVLHVCLCCSYGGSGWGLGPGSVFVGPGFVSTSPAFMRISASHPAGPHGRLSQKNCN